MTILHSTRLRLEPLDDQHFAGLQAMNRLPEVMRFIGRAPETPERTRMMIAVVKERWASHGFSWWAFIERSSGALVGAGCIQHLGRDPAKPLELGWRLVPQVWGHPASWRRLGMRYRGRETWYERAHDVYQLDRTHWLAQRAARLAQ